MPKIKKKLKSVADLLPEISPRQLLFITHYLAGNTATASYIKAGYSNRGAQQSACKMLTNPVISGIIAAHKTKMAEKWEISEDRILQRLASHAFTDLSHVMLGGSGVNLMPFSDMNPLHAPAIKSISESSGDGGMGSQSVTMHCPLAATKELVKLLNLFPNQRGSKKENAELESDSPEAIDATLTERISGIIQRRKGQAGA